MAKQVPLAIQTHKQKVCSLYKRALRSLEDWYQAKHIVRYHASLLRARFDENKNLRDEVKIQNLLENGEKELFEKQHWQPAQYPNTIGGNAYGREIVTPDWVLDYWHPLEKAQYPKYFIKREERKLEFIKLWEKEFGGLPPSKHH